MRRRNLLRSLTRSDPTISLDEWAQLFSFQGLGYPFIQQSLGEKVEEFGGDFAGLIQGAYKSNGVVFACMLVRQLLFSEARFQFRQMRDGRPGDLFGTQDLTPLEVPWPNGTTGDLLTRAIQDADLAGNFYCARRPGGVRRLRPDWVTIVLGSTLEPENPRAALDVEVAGYIYHPGGRGSGDDPIPLERDEVAHFAPIPDPQANFRGMSWLTPVIREIAGDQAASTHKLRFFENGATPNLVVSLDPGIDRETFEKWIEAFDERLEGTANAYKTLYLGGGAEAKTIGANLRQVDFKQVQGAGETRIAAAAGVPPVIVGLSEGLQAATYSNYAQARRRFADGTMRPLWRNIAGSLATIIKVPGGSELWYDDRDIPFLQEDQADKAKIQQIEATALASLIQAGFAPDAAVEFIASNDITKLEHTGLTSVQLMEPGKAPQNGTPSPDVTAAAARTLAQHRWGKDD